MKKTIYSVSIVFLVLAMVYFITGFFQAYNKPIQSKNLLLESWLSTTVIEKAAQYIASNDIESVYIVNMKEKNANDTNSWFRNYKKREIKERGGRIGLVWSGILRYRIPATEINDTGIIKIGMYGTPVQNIYPHYKVFANNQLLKTGFVTGKDSTYFFPFRKANTDTIIDLILNFDNDALSYGEDRNMYVTKVMIDSTDIKNIVPHEFFLVQNKRFSPLYYSNAENIKIYLSDFKINPDKIEIFETNYDKLNKTLALAEQAGVFFQNSKVKDINIFTISNHSRRTYLNFRNCIKKDIQVGCIVSDFEDKPEWYDFSTNIDERGSLLLSWMYWWFH